MRKRILITGASGYIGSRMIESLLLSQNLHILAVDKNMPEGIFSDLQHKDRLELLREDIERISQNTLKNIDSVINLASISSDKAGEIKKSETKKINFTLAINLARKAKLAGVKKYIYPSTCNVYGSATTISRETTRLHPNSTYTKTKAMAEKALIRLASPLFCVTILRLSPIYGLSKRNMRFDLVVHIMTLHAMTKKKVFIMGDGKQYHPLIHIDDAVRAFEIILNEKNISKINGKIFNIGGNSENYQILSVAQAVKKVFPLVTMEYIPESTFGRNFRVNFDKFNTMYNFKTTKRILDGVREIKRGIEAGDIKIPKVENRNNT